jgi:formate-dependent nitrite reductase membrane component NrfD
MTRVELPMAKPSWQANENGSLGSTHQRGRDAYRDVPILQQPTWQHPIAAYFFAGGISSGAYLVGTVATLTGGARLRTMARLAHYVSFAALLPCPPLLIMDLGKPGRFYHMLRIFKPSSPMSLGSWALTTHGMFCALAAFVGLAHDADFPILGPALRVVPEAAVDILGLPSALVLGGYTGVLLGTSSVPLWATSPLLGALFMASAINTGLAAVTLAGALSGRDSDAAHRAMAPLAVCGDVVEMALLGGYMATSGQAIQPLRGKREGLEIAGAAALIGVALAVEVAGLRAARGRHRRSALAATATLMGGALLRWGIVFAGHRSAADRETMLKTMAPSAPRRVWGAG